MVPHFSSPGRSSKERGSERERMMYEKRDEVYSKLITDNTPQR